MWLAVKGYVFENPQMPFKRSLMCTLEPSPSGDLLTAIVRAVARLRAGTKRIVEEASTEKTRQLDHLAPWSWPGDLIPRLISCINQRPVKTADLTRQFGDQHRSGEFHYTLLRVVTRSHELRRTPARFQKQKAAGLEKDRLRLLKPPPPRVGATWADR
jgi:hypothetical protein